MDLIIWGGTGNFKVVREIAIAAGHSIVALFDNNSQAMSPFAEIPKVGGLSELPNWWNQRKGKQTGYVVTFGGGLGRDRVDIINQLDALGLSAVPMLHSRAYVSESARLHPSSQVYAMTAICTEAVIGKGCLINTGASVDHESELGEGVFIGPGARLAGLVKVDRFADIYTGAIILPRVHIGEGAVVGAGSVVRKHVPPYTMVAGNPARVIKEIPVP